VCIYALVWTDGSTPVAVYVGQSRRLLDRLHSHVRSGKRGWDYCLCLEWLPGDTPRWQAEQHELAWIIRFLQAGIPVRNRKHAPPALIDYLVTYKK
jgi:hypothetical protein